MNKTKLYIYIVFLSLFLLGAANLKKVPNSNPIIKLEYPDYFPQPNYDFERAPLTKKGIELGRKLFYDSILSKDSTISCSNCHLSFTAFSHVDHALSHGINDSIGTRNSPALMNLAWAKHFMWDGAINHIEVQALAPIAHPAEMGEDFKHVIQKLQQTQIYPPLFYEVFKDSIITGENFLKALTQFQLVLVSANSKYDKVKRKETGVTFTSQEETGYTVFKKHCNTCHQEPLFTTGDFANNGLPVDTTLMDWGRYFVTKAPSDSLKFKIPTLRNIEFSYPYMHDGRFKKLSQVIKHYTKGIQTNPTLAPQLQQPIKLSHKEKIDLIAFLLTLSDKDFLFNPDYGFPRQ